MGKTREESEQAPGAARAPRRESVNECAMNSGRTPGVLPSTPQCSLRAYSPARTMKLVSPARSCARNHLSESGGRYDGEEVVRARARTRQAFEADVGSIVRQNNSTLRLKSRRGNS